MSLYTWVFNPWEFHSYLVGCTAAEAFDAFNVLALMREARTAADLANHAAVLYKEAIRYDDTWLTDEPTLLRLYILCMAPHLRSPHRAVHAGLLVDYLKSIGWTDEERRLLARGESLAKMLERDRSDPLLRALGDDLRRPDFGGWLSPEHVASLKRKLLDAGAEIDSPVGSYLRQWTDVEQQAQVCATLGAEWQSVVQALASIEGESQAGLRVIFD